MERRYRILIGRERRGPLAIDQLPANGLQPETLVWADGGDAWVPAHEVPEHWPLLAAAVGRISRAWPHADGSKASAPPHTLEPRPEAYLARPYAFAKLMYALMVVTVVFSSWLFVPLVFGLGGSSEARTLFFVGYMLAAAFLIAWWIACVVVVYRCWTIIKTGKDSWFPVIAIGFLFVPLLQFVWVFAAIFGLALALNRYADRHRLNAPRASILLSLAVSVFAVLALIPYLGAAFAVLFLLLFPVCMGTIFRSALGINNGILIVDENAAMKRPTVAHFAWYAGILAIILVVASVVLVGEGLLAIGANGFPDNPDRSIYAILVGISCFVTACVAATAAAESNRKLWPRPMGDSEVPGLPSESL